MGDCTSADRCFPSFREVLYVDGRQLSEESLAAVARVFNSLEMRPQGTISSGLYIEADRSEYGAQALACTPSPTKCKYLSSRQHEFVFASLIFQNTFYFPTLKVRRSISIFSHRYCLHCLSVTLEVLSRRIRAVGT